MTTAVQSRIDASKAKVIAGEYLFDRVSSFMIVGEAALAEGLWRMPVILSYPTTGKQAEVGSIAVDASNGELRFSDSDRKRIEKNARAFLASASPPPGNV